MMEYFYKFEKENCWYKDVCKNFNDPKKCCENCIRFMEMNYLMWASQIPKARQYKEVLIPSMVDETAFTELAEIKSNIKNWVAQGNNLYIYSNICGNGKTSWAIKLLKTFFNEVWLYNNCKCRGMFIHVPSFLTKIKMSFGKKDDELNFILENILKCDLVVWDDIAITDISKFDYTTLLTYIDQRILAKKSNIFTGNLTEDQLRLQLGERLTSRIYNGSKCVEFKGNDRRNAN